MVGGARLGEKLEVVVRYLGLATRRNKMPLTNEEIVQMIAEKSREIQVEATINCTCCGCAVTSEQGRSKIRPTCEHCEKLATIERLRNLVAEDDRYLSVLQAAEAAEF